MKPSPDCSSSKCLSQLPELHYFIVKGGKIWEFRQAEQSLRSERKSKVKKGLIFPATETYLPSSFAQTQEQVKWTQFSKLLWNNQGLKGVLMCALGLMRRYIPSSLVLQNQ